VQQVIMRVDVFRRALSHGVRSCLILHRYIKAFRVRI
jgi:hypothetical protein